VHVPAIPALAWQLEQAQNPQQLVRRVRHRNLAGNPVPNGAWRDMKKLRRLINSQSRIREQDFEAGALQGADFTELGRRLFLPIVLYTMYIMLSNELESGICDLSSNR
jgi:hypothetical protein